MALARPSAPVSSIGKILRSMRFPAAAGMKALIALTSSARRSSSAVSRREAAGFQGLQLTQVLYEAAKPQGLVMEGFHGGPVRRVDAVQDGLHHAPGCRAAGVLSSCAASAMMRRRDSSRRSSSSVMPLKEALSCASSVAPRTGTLMPKSPAATRRAAHPKRESGPTKPEDRASPKPRAAKAEAAPDQTRIHVTEAQEPTLSPEGRDGHGTHHQRADALAVLLKRDALRQVAGGDGMIPGERLSCPPSLSPSRRSGPRVCRRRLGVGPPGIPARPPNRRFGDGSPPAGTGCVAALLIGVVQVVAE